MTEKPELLPRCDACGVRCTEKGKAYQTGEGETLDDVAFFCAKCWAVATKKHGAQKRDRVLSQATSLTQGVQPDFRGRIVAVSVVRGELPPLLKRIAS